MSTTSQSDNESRSPAQAEPSIRSNRSTLASQPNHRTRPYATPLPRNGGSQQPHNANNSQPARGGGPTGPGNRAAHHIPTVGTARLNGQPGVGVVTQWPPNFVTFDSSEAHLDNHYYDYLARTYDLRAPYTDFAGDIVQVPTPRQYSVLLYSVLSIRQAVDLLLHDRDVAPNGSLASAGIPLSVQARIFPYQNHFKTFVQNHAKEVLISPTLDVYCSHPVRGAPAAGRTLLEQVMDHVQAQSDEFKLDYLPVGFISGELSALASVNAELRDRLKHERGAMRNLLLTNVHEPSGRPITHPVPSLTNLLIDMTQRMVPGGERAAVRATDKRLRSRVAHLQIQTMAHYARRGTGHANRQWALIDEQLVDLRAREPLYRRSFYRLIIQLDSELFGDTMYSDMDVDRIRPPTEEEVMAHMALVAEE